MKNSHRFHDLWNFFLIFQTEGQLEVFDMKNPPKSFSHEMFCTLPKFESEDCWSWEMTNWRSASFRCCHAISKQSMGASNWKRDELSSRELFLVFYYFLVCASCITSFGDCKTTKLKISWNQVGWRGRPGSKGRVGCHDNLDVMFTVYQR